MTILAYSKWYSKGQVLTLNAFDTVIFTFIVFDDLTHFQKICLKRGFLLNNNLCKNEQIRYQQDNSFIPSYRNLH